jgi:prevent-host-death family protein
MPSRSTGVRDAKANLSKMLRDVERGYEWVITDHGRPVARLVPVSSAALPLEARLRRLEDMGLIEPRRGTAQDLPAPLRVKRGTRGLLQRWLREDRDAR